MARFKIDKVSHGESQSEKMLNKKRVQHCSSCKNHGAKTPKRGHHCKYLGCNCILCKLLQHAQMAMRHQQRVWRHQKQKLKTENYELEDLTNVLDANGDTKCQVCDKCRNHNKLVRKRNHQCIYANCSCDYCTLTFKRREIMKHLQRVRRSGVTSAAHPDVKKAEEFLAQNKSHFQFSDEDGSSNSDDEEDTEETQQEDDQNSLSDKRESEYSPELLPPMKSFNEKKQRLLMFSTSATQMENRSPDVVVGNKNGKDDLDDDQKEVFALADDSGKFSPRRNKFHPYEQETKSRQCQSPLKPNSPSRRPPLVNSPPPLIPMMSCVSYSPFRPFDNATEELSEEPQVRSSSPKFSYVMAPSQLPEIDDSERKRSRPSSPLRYLPNETPYPSYGPQFPFSAPVPLQHLSALNASLDYSTRSLKFDTHRHGLEACGCEWIPSPSFIRQSLGVLRHTNPSLLRQRLQEEQHQRQVHKLHHPVIPQPISMIREPQPPVTLPQHIWRQMMLPCAISLASSANIRSQSTLSDQNRFSSAESSPKFSQADIFHSS